MTITKMITDCESITELSDVCEEWSGSFGHVQAAPAFTKTPKMPHSRSAAARQLLDRLAALWEEQLPAAGPRQLANVLWACGKLRYSSSSLWSSTVAAFMQLHRGEAVAQHYANVLYALASIGIANKGEVPGLTRQEVAEVFEALTGEVYVMAAAPATTANFQDISNTLWAHAKLGIQPPAADLCGLLKAAVRPQLLGDAIAQNISNIVWAVSALRQLPGWEAQVQQQVWEQLLAEPQLQKLSVALPIDDLAGAAFAVSALVLPAAAGTAPVISLEFAQQRVSRLLQGRTTQELDTWGEQAVSNVLYACARLGLRDEQLFQGLASAAPGWLPQAGVAAVSQVALACGQLGFKDKQLLAALLRRAEQLFKLNHNTKMANFVLMTCVSWAVAVLDVPELVGSMEQLFVVSGIKQLQEPSRQQCHQAVVCAHLAAGVSP